MRTRYLRAVRKQQTWTLAIDQSLQPPSLDSCDGYRVSPIFPILPGEPISPDFEGAASVGLFFFDRPFAVIGLLLNELPADQAAQVWFSLGLASVVVVTRDADLLGTIASVCSEELRAFETWDVSNGTITGTEARYFATPAPVPSELYTLGDYSRLSPDVRGVLDEFAICLHAAVTRAAQYLPQELVVYQRLVLAVNQTIQELFFLETAEGPVPLTLPKDLVTDLPKHRTERQRRIHQRVDQLIQLNSAFSYVISQQFGGTSPVLGHESHVRRYSLLGIGTAVKGLAAFTRWVERAFVAYPVDEVVATTYPTLQGVDIFPALLNYDPAKWIHEDFRVDKYFPLANKFVQKPKLVSFSGRLGFRESEFSVTAAIQVLTSGDSVRWSLMTLSHELMHAHVRALMSAIFQDWQDRISHDYFKEYYANFEQVWNSGYDETARWKLRDCLQFIVLNFCCVKPVYDSIDDAADVDDDPVTFTTDLPAPDELWRRLSEDYKFINHVFVHVFDYNYFYEADDVTYINLLWRSWSTVPAVLEHLDQYLLRTIVTIASSDSGPVEVRCSNATKIVLDALGRVAAADPSNLVIGEARHRLEAIKEDVALLARFTPAIYLADAAVHFLLSERVRGELLNVEDPHAELSSDGEYTAYRLEAGIFSNRPVKNPILLVHDRLRRNLASDTGEDEEYDSAWTLLACASALGDGGDVCSTESASLLASS